MVDHPPPSTLVLETLEGHAFEDIVERLLVKMGFRIHGRQSSADGGIDMVAESTETITGGRFIIQCKRYAGTVGAPILRELYGVVQSERANKGILITTASFTPDAVAFATDKPLELIDGNALRALLSRHDVRLGESHAFAIGPGVGVVYTQLCKAFDTIRDESDRISNGLVFITKRTFNLKEYADYMDTQVEAIESGLNFVKPIALAIGGAMNKQTLTQEEDRTLRSNIKRPASFRGPMHCCCGLFRNS
jgi:hypothetical protein